MGQDVEGYMVKNNIHNMYVYIYIVALCAPKHCSTGCTKHYSQIIFSSKDNLVGLKYWNAADTVLHNSVYYIHLYRYINYKTYINI